MIYEAIQKQAKEIWQVGGKPNAVRVSTDGISLLKKQWQTVFRDTKLESGGSIEFLETAFGTLRVFEDKALEGEQCVVLAEAPKYGSPPWWLTDNNWLATVKARQATRDISLGENMSRDVLIAGAWRHGLNDPTVVAEVERRREAGFRQLPYESTVVELADLLDSYDHLTNELLTGSKPPKEAIGEPVLA